MPGALEGVKVLEFSEIIAGPYGGMLLADMGADVIKVEPPCGEAWRLIQQFIPLESRTYMAVNRGKRSLPLDLTKPEGVRIAHELVPLVDVVLVTYRPDVPVKLGIDYETLAQKNPRLIYCSNTAFGSVGPKADLPGYDLLVQALSGLMAAEGKISDGIPQHIFTPVADTATGISIAWSICAALFARERTGKGQHIETTLLGTALGMQGSRFMRVEAHDADTQKMLVEDVSTLQEQGVAFPDVFAQYQSYHAGLPGNIYYRNYRTKDGVLAVACLSNGLRMKLLEVLKQEDPCFDPYLNPELAKATELSEELVVQTERIFFERTNQDWTQRLFDAGVPAAPVRFTEEMLDDEQVWANEMAIDLDHDLAGPVRMSGHLVKMHGTPLDARSASPALGQHTNEVLESLGYSGDHIQHLKDIGVTL